MKNLIRCMILRRKLINFKQLRSSGVSQWIYRTIQKCSFNRGKKSSTSELKKNSTRNNVRFIDIGNDKKKNRKVHFDLHPTIFMFKNTPDDDLYRKQYWQTYAIDRKRFSDRIKMTEDKLKFIFDHQHREDYYHRFILNSVQQHM